MRPPLTEQRSKWGDTTGQQWLGIRGHGGDIKKSGVGHTRDVRDDRSKVKTQQHYANEAELRRKA